MKTLITYTNPNNHQVMIKENVKSSSRVSTLARYGKGFVYNEDIVEDKIIYPNGEEKVVYYSTSYYMPKKMPYADMIEAFIRCKYTINDEFAILRQRDTKPEAFKTYDEEVEKIKSICKEFVKMFK